MNLYKPTETEYRKINKLIAAVFMNDSFWEALSKNDKQKYNFGLFVLDLNVLTASGTTNVYATSPNLEGAIIYIDKDDPQQPKMSNWEVFKNLVRIFGLFGAIRAAYIFLKEEKRKKKYIKNEGYYLSVIAVDKKHQGKGYASKLMNEFLHLADKNKKDVHLTTANPKNVEIYKHFGFKIVYEYTLIADCHIWMMKRECK